MRSLYKLSITAFSILALVGLLSACGPKSGGGGGGGGGGSGGGTDLTVNTTDNSYDGTCDAAHCSLKEAITIANSSPVLVTIKFNISGGGVQTIHSGIGFPTVMIPMVIDGTSQPGYAGEPLIVLDGSPGSSGDDGLYLSGGGITLKGLVIQNFSGYGIHMSAGGGNFIFNCYIGTDATGTTAAPNHMGGIMVNSGDGNMIGGMGPFDRNVISGNLGIGLNLSSFNNIVVNNYIGTDVSGTFALGNSGAGVLVSGSDNEIGGIYPLARNLVSGNLENGVVLTGVSNQVLNNFIGVNAAGNAALGNLLDGVFVNADLSLVGGTTAAERNIISGNGGNGVRIEAGAVLVQGNYIGTNAAGTAALGNQLSGVYAFGMGSIQVGGSDPGAMNVISANQLFGVYVEDDSHDVSIYGNRIGTNAAGTSALGNVKGGVRLSGVDLQVGASFDGGGNLISGNGGPGIAVVSGSDGIVIRGNYIGTDQSGSSALGNDTGIEVGMGAPAGDNVMIGGGAFEDRNIISGNLGDGLLLYKGATVQRNLIGMGTTEAPLGNGGNGILIKGSGNLIGGTDVDNVITNNGMNGIAVISESGGAVGNSLLDNMIYDNDGLGIVIDEDAVIPNDSQDLDSGDNNRQNYPVMVSAVIDTVAGNTTYHGTLNSAPGTIYTIQIYSDAFCDPSGYGEGRAMVQSFALTTDVNGLAMFTQVGPYTFYEAGDVVSSTATDPDGNTSEFSNCIPVTVVSGPTWTPTAASFTFTPDINAYCRFGPDPIFGWDDHLAMKGQAYPIDGRNFENTWLRLMLTPDFGCWVPRDVGTPSGDTSLVRVLAAIPTPTFTPAPFNCEQITDPTTCRRYQSVCNWVSGPTGALGTCKNK